AGEFRLRQFGERQTRILDPVIADDQRYQIGIGKVAVVVGVLFTPHGAGRAAVRVEEARLLMYLPSLLVDLDLPLDLVLYSLFHETERVDVLGLGPGAELVRADRHDRNVRIAAEAPFLHVAVADAEIDDDLVQLLQVGDRFVGGPDVRFGDDLQKRSAGPVQVDAGAAPQPRHIAVHQLAGILFHVDSGDTDTFPDSFDLDVQMPVLADREFVLADLVSFGEIRVEVVLPGEDRAGGNSAMGGQTGLDCKLHDLLVQYRQGARQAETDRAGLRVGGGAELRRAAAEDLGAGFQLDVYF